MKSATLLPAIVSAASASIFAMGSNQSAHAITITFDDLPGTELLIPRNYQGFNWSDDFYYANGRLTGGGYIPGAVSSPNVALNGFGNNVSFSRNTPFDFNSAYLTAAWNNGLNVLVQGVLGGVLQNTATVIVNTNAPTLVNFNFLNVDTVRFSSFGGVDAGLGRFGTQFALDNLTYNATNVTNATNANAVPEPFTVLGGVVALGAGAMLKRKQKKTTKA